MKSSAQKYRKKLRLEGYQYNTPGYYHIVIVTEERKKLLGSLHKGELTISDYGKTIENLLENFSEYNPGVEIVKYVIMPDHIHLLLHLFEGEKSENPPSIPMIVSKIKTLSVWMYENHKKATGHVPLPTVVWQRSFYNHIIRSYEKASFTFDYIDYNPDQDSE